MARASVKATRSSPRGDEVKLRVDASASGPPGKLSEQACPHCLRLAREGSIDSEMVQRLPEGVWAPTLKSYRAARCTVHEECAADPEMGRACALADGRRCCRDCAAAELVILLAGAPGFIAARIAVGSDRREQYRLPGMNMGLVAAGLMLPSAPGDFEDQLRWLDGQDWFEAVDLDEDDP